MKLAKMLIADSDVTLVESLAEHFRRQGVQVKTAYDALTVLKLVHQELPDVVCLGINLRCDNGVCVCELLSQERRFAFMPAVLLTDRADDWLTHDCHSLRAFYTPKGGDLAVRVEHLALDAVSAEPVAHGG